MAFSFVLRNRNDELCIRIMIFIQFLREIFKNPLKYLIMMVKMIVCISIPDQLLKWLKEMTEEMGTDPESFIVRILWQYHDVAKASERVSKPNVDLEGLECKETPEGFLICTD